MTQANVGKIYCGLNVFCKFFEPELEKHVIEEVGKRYRNRLCRVSDHQR